MLRRSVPPARRGRTMNRMPAAKGRTVVQILVALAALAAIALPAGASIPRPGQLHAPNPEALLATARDAPAPKAAATSRDTRFEIFAGSTHARFHLELQAAADASTNARFHLLTPRKTRVRGLRLPEPLLIGIELPPSRTVFRLYGDVPDRFASEGLYITEDPLGYVDGPNLYQYGLNNPVNFSDPLGLQTAVEPSPQVDLPIPANDNFVLRPQPLPSVPPEAPLLLGPGAFEGPTPYLLAFAGGWRIGTFVGDLRPNPSVNWTFNDSIREDLTWLLLVAEKGGTDEANRLYLEPSPYVTPSGARTDEEWTPVFDSQGKVVARIPPMMSSHADGSNVQRGRTVRQLGPVGDAGAQGLTRMERFRSLAESGFQVGEERFSINPHLLNSLRKSGRRHIDPESMVRALATEPTAGTPGSVVFVDPETGTRFFVNDSNEVVGVHPSSFQ